MVLESLFNPFVVKKKPWEMFLVGVVYTLVSLPLAYFVFRDAAGLLAVFLIVIAALPMFYITIKNEEAIDIKYHREWFILKEHGRVLSFLMFFFGGVTVALAATYILLPSTVVDNIFGLQQQAIIGVNNVVQGKITQVDLIARIFTSNLKVLFFCILFSFLYGTGALFILTWNASVVATAMGNLFKTKLAEGAALVGWPLAANYFQAASFSFFRYMTHGALEMASYFIAGIAGGIISIAFIKRNFNEEQIFVDVLDMLFISLGLLFAAAIIEVYITPALFY